VVATSVGRFWDLGRFRSRLFRSGSRVSRSEVSSFVGIVIGTYLDNNWPLFKIELEPELGVLPHLKQV
jgi:hypothetical protein